MNILGISAFYHDSAACLVQCGTIVAVLHKKSVSPEKNMIFLPLRMLLIIAYKKGG